MTSPIGIERQEKRVTHYPSSSVSPPSVLPHQVGVALDQYAYTRPLSLALVGEINIGAINTVQNRWLN